MVVSLQFLSSHQKYMMGFCLANLLQSCGKQVAYTMDMVSDLDATAQANQADGRQQTSLAQVLKELANDSAGLEALLATYTEEALIEALKSIYKEQFAIDAATNNCLKALKMTLAAGVNREIRDAHARTLLHIAAFQGYTDMLTLLLDVDKQPNIETKNELEHTPLASAVFNGHAEVVNILLAAGANINVKGLLHSAAYKGHIDIIKNLLAAGADLEVKDAIGYTPLFLAGIAGHVEVVTTLIKAGANVEAKSNDGTTPLGIVAYAGGHHIKEKNDDGTSLDTLAYKRHAEVAQILIGAGANLEATNNDGNTPFDIAVLCKKQEVIAVLLAAMNKKSGSV